MCTTWQTSLLIMDNYKCKKYCFIGIGTHKMKTYSVMFCISGDFHIAEWMILLVILLQYSRSDRSLISWGHFFALFCKYYVTTQVGRNLFCIWFWLFRDNETITSVLRTEKLVSFCLVKMYDTEYIKNSLEL